jgi:hypothetical protein
MTAVFLSASVPDPRRHARYFNNTSVGRIREAITQLARAVLPTGEFTFGGHPAISPLVLAVAGYLGAKDRVVIYQSEFFRSLVPPESLAFSRIVWTPAVRADPQDSLRAMREAMVRSTDFRAAFFIGGMEGVEEELATFRSEHPGAAIFPVASTGGAARVLFQRGEGPIDPLVRNQLEKSLVYGYLFPKLLAMAP